MEPRIIANESLAWRVRIADYLSLERNVAIASAAVFLLGIGEELWKKCSPKYLEALGASTPIIGLFDQPGFPLLTKNDYETAERAAFIYDALYASIKQEQAPK